MCNKFYDANRQRQASFRAKKQIKRESAILSTCVLNLFTTIRPHVLYDSVKSILFVSVFSLEGNIYAQLKGKFLLRAEMKSKKKIFFLEWPRARDEKKSRLEFFHFITKIVVTALVQQLSVAFSSSS
jgi:hypothetical protein